MSVNAGLYMCVVILCYFMLRVLVCVFVSTNVSVRVLTAVLRAGEMEGVCVMRTRPLLPLPVG